MLVQFLSRSMKPGLRIMLPCSNRTFSMTTAWATGGDTGASKSSQGDAFSKRGAADEDYHVRLREMEKLEALKKKIAEQKEHLSKLDQHVEGEMNSGSGKK